jgi:hypothetical protein
MVVSMSTACFNAKRNCTWSPQSAILCPVRLSQETAALCPNSCTHADEEKATRHKGNVEMRLVCPVLRHVSSINRRSFMPQPTEAASFPRTKQSSCQLTETFHPSLDRHGSKETRPRVQSVSTFPVAPPPLHSAFAALTSYSRPSLLIRIGRT